MAIMKTIRKRADKLGFGALGIVDLTAHEPDNAQWLREFISKHYHGSMAWMEDSLERRVHPNAMWSEAKSAIVLGFNYGPDSDPLITIGQTGKATISVYARNKDYHQLIKGKLKELAGILASDTGADVKVFVDTAPLMEKPLSAAGGIGWQGKHTNLVSREFGSWLFLGVILTEAKLPSTVAETDHCGNCTACLDICPTRAFPAPYQIDARRCISYLTIEHKGPVDLELRALMGNRIYGCDDCLAICPWNKFAQQASEIKLQAREDLNAPDLAGLAALTETQFREKFSGSPIKRIGHAQFIRNVLYAIGNSGRGELRGAAKAHIGSPSEVVADAAIWAAGRLESL
ncbi:MAG: tRNA epoxyqueuosine(34) reductase QueG [Robiginitomaculum sp.]